MDISFKNNALRAEKPPLAPWLRRVYYVNGEDGGDGDGLLSRPIFDPNALDVLKVLAVVSHHHKVLGLCCATDEQVEVVYLLSCLPKGSSLLRKGMNDFTEWDNPHFGNKLFYLSEIFLNPFAVVGTEQKFSHHNIGDIALVSSISLSLSSTLRFPLSRNTQILVSRRYPFIAQHRMS